MNSAVASELVIVRPSTEPPVPGHRGNAEPADGYSTPTQVLTPCPRLLSLQPPSTVASAHGSARACMSPSPPETARLQPGLSSARLATARAGTPVQQASRTMLPQHFQTSPRAAKTPPSAPAIH